MKRTRVRAVWFIRPELASGTLGSLADPGDNCSKVHSLPQPTRNTDFNRYP